MRLVTVAFFVLYYVCPKDVAKYELSRLLPNVEISGSLVGVAGATGEGEVPFSKVNGEIPFS